MPRPDLGVSDSYTNVTPSDSTNIVFPPRALYVGTGGTLNLATPYDGTNILFRNVPSGYKLDVSCIRVNSTDTTASNIVALA